MPVLEPTRPTERLEVATLLGSRGLDRSISCLRSFVARSLLPVSLRIHDDGSLGETELAALSRSLPISRLIRRTDADAQLEQLLDGRPACLAFRRTNVLALKLFDCLLLEESERLRYVDSDVLFLRTFDGSPLLLDSDRAVFFPDEQSAYSLRSIDIVRPSSPRLPASLNTGFFGFPTRRFDLDAIERFLRSWRGRTPPWVEQTCWAITAGVTETSTLDPIQFQIFEPNGPDIHEAIALHFVSPVRAHLDSFLEDHAPRPSEPPVTALLHDARRLRWPRLFLEEIRRAFGRLTR